MNDKRNERRSLAEMLRGYAPRPSQAYHARMAGAPWQQPQSRANAPWLSARPRLIGVLAAFVLIVVAVALATPEVRASLSSWLGLGVSPSAVVTPPAVQPAELVSSKTLGPISKQAGWTVVAPAWVPEGYRFGQANYDTRNNLVYLSFLA